jgi:uncharacterized protein (TIGR03083 family)
VNDLTRAFGDTRARVIELVRSIDEAAAMTVVPACPAWNVHDLVAHIAGVSGDVITGTVGGAGSEAWTRAQIEARTESSFADLVDEIQSKGAEVEAALEFLHPAVAAAIFGDLVTHEHDLRGALGRPGARDSTAVRIALESYVRFFGRRIKDAGLPSISVEGDEESWIAGAGDPRARVAAPDFSLLRGLTGRRTHDEIRAFTWGGERDEYVAIFSMYGIPQRSLREDQPSP